MESERPHADKDEKGSSRLELPQDTLELALPRDTQAESSTEVNPSLGLELQPTKLSLGAPHDQIAGQ